jgi:haloalkane dehalogenase
MDALERATGLAYRSAGTPGEQTLLFVHGYPESSFMWREAMAVAAEAGWHAIAPDLAGYGDSEPSPPGTWERHVEALGRFVAELELGPVVLVTHDWGVMIGLRWACDEPQRVRGLVISDGGFFADRRWHDLANVMRTPEEGEQLIAGYTSEAFGAGMKALSPGMNERAVAEYWKAFADPVRRQAHLELYRSGDFDKLEPYEGRLAQLGVPSLILWGANDNFAGPKMAERFHAELPGSELHVIDDTGHFVWDDAPGPTGELLVDFLARSFAVEAVA